MASEVSTIADVPAAERRRFRLIRLELARDEAHPSGSNEIGYTVLAPFDSQGRIDGELWKPYRQACRVVRFRPDEEHDIGHLMRRANGNWAFHYDVRGDEADEAGYHFGDERFVIGEYVSIREAEGMRTFRVVSSEPV